MKAKETVRAGYDLVSEVYRPDAFDGERSMYRTFLSWVETRLRDGDRVLDLGCGCGVPVGRTLSSRFRVLGVDISPVQIGRARRLVPDAEFRCEDFTKWDPPGAFEAVVAFYSIIHVPLAEQPALFDAIGTWLVPGGILLATVGWKAWTGTEENWHGVPGATMYWSHANVSTYRAWLEERGFRIVREGFVPEGDGGHPVLLARAAGA